MKTRIKIITVALLVLFSCTKDFDGHIVDSFDFQFTGRNIEKGYVLQGLNTSFTINPSKDISNAKFFFDYKVIKGDGHLVDQEGNIYEGGETQVDKMAWNYSYVPLTPGDHQVTYMVRDHRDNTVEMSMDYQVDYAPFTAILKSATNKYVINRHNELLLIMLSENTSKLLDSTYTVTYSLDGGIGEIYRDSTALGVGSAIPFGKGNTKLTYVPSSLGTHTLSMECTSPDGRTKKVEQTFEVDNTTFFMSAEPVTTTALVGDELGINVTLQSTDLTQVTQFDLQFYFAGDSQGSGTLLDPNGEELASAEKYSITPGKHIYRFSSQTKGRKKLYFDISDSNNQIKRDTVVFDYLAKSFDFRVNSPNEDIPLGEPVTLRFDLIGESPNETFSMGYSLETGNGKLLDADSSEVRSGVSVPVSAGTWEYSFVPATMGTNSLAFEIKDAQGESREVTVNFNVGESFGFTLISDRNTYEMEQEAEIIFNIDGEESYTATYTTDNDGVLSYNGSSYQPGSSFSIDRGTSFGSYQAFGHGNHTLELTVVSPNGETRIGSLSFSYNELDTSISLGLTASPTERLVGETALLDIELEGNEDYTANYSNTNSGILIYNGSNILPGQSFVIATGSSSASYTGTTNGVHTIALEVTGTSGAQAFANGSVTYTTPIDTSITFSANQDANFATIGQTVGINFTLGGNEEYTASYTNSSAGTLVYNGATIAPGQDFEIQKGNTLAYYTGSVEASHRLNFTVTSNSGAQSSDLATIAYNEPIDTSLSFSANPALTDGTLGGQPIAIDFLLDGNENYTVTYVNDNVGIFSYNGTTISEGESFVISQGASSGSYRGTNEGSHTLNFTVTSNSGQSISDTATMTFSSSTVAVTGVTVSPTSATVTQGGTRNLTATVQPTNATDQNVTWATSNASVATVSTTGVVTAVAPGTATITATTQDGGFTATSTITVQAATISVTGVTVSPTSATVTEGSTQNLTATVQPTNATDQNVTWATSNASVATVSTTGVVTAIAPGTATIMVNTLDGGFQASATITVQAATIAVTGVTVSPTSATVTQGGTRNLTATVQPTNATNRNVTWATSNASVATVSTTGVVTAVAPGTATITVNTLDGGFQASTTITVQTATVAVTGVSVDATSATLTQGNTRNLTATVQPTNASNQNVTWATSNASVATVSTTGVVTAIAPGTATITVNTLDGGFQASTTITVQTATVAVTGVSVNPTSATVTQGNTRNITATVQPTNASNQNVTWTTSNASVATVSATGVVTAIAPGTATITVTTQDGNRTATSSITVQAATVAVTGVSVDATSATLTQGNTRNLTATVQPTNATNQNVTWTTSNASVATVSATGVVSGVSAGTATISVTTAEGDFTATSNITVEAAVNTNIIENAWSVPAGIYNAAQLRDKYTYRDNNFSTAVGTLTIMAEEISQVAGATGNFIEIDEIRVSQPGVAASAGPSIEGVTVSIPNNTDFDIYFDIYTNARGANYAGARTTIRFTISNGVTTITRDYVIGQD